MSNRKLGENTCVIHERALNMLGLKASLAMLGVAHDLRNGIIKKFDMRHY
jgi:hypothetical protein